MVHESPNFKAARWLSTGMLKGDDYFVLLDAAREFEADTAFRLNFGVCKMMASKAASSLATLHGAALDTGSYKGGDLTTFKGNCWYDVRALLRYVSPRPDSLSCVYDENNPLATAERQTLRDAIQSCVDRYSDVVENKPAMLCPTAVHGDMHGGNLFISDDSELSMLIDYGGITWTLGKNFGTGDRGNDLGRLIGNIFVEGVKRKFDLHSQTKELIQTLIREYTEQTGIKLDSEQGRALLTSAEFYAHRFIAVNAQDTSAKKCKPIGDETLPELRKRLYHDWLHLSGVFHI
jgi:hypothetical protein